MNGTAPARAALITGAGRRIGAAIARALARDGYAVVLHAHRSRSEAEDTAGEIAAAGGTRSIVLADLADGVALAGLVPAAAAFGPLTLLVNNASLFEEDEVATLDRARVRAHDGGQSHRAFVPGAGLRRAGRGGTPRSSTSSTSACSSRRRASSPTR